MRELATALVEGEVEMAFATPKSPSSRAVAVYYPHLDKLSKRTGIPAEKLVPAWEHASEAVDKQYPAESALKRFIRATVLVFAHAHPEKT